MAAAGGRGHRSGGYRSRGGRRARPGRCTRRGGERRLRRRQTRRPRRPRTDGQRHPDGAGPAFRGPRCPHRVGGRDQDGRLAQGRTHRAAAGGLPVRDGRGAAPATSGTARAGRRPIDGAASSGCRGARLRGEVGCAARPGEPRGADRASAYRTSADRVHDAAGAVFPRGCRARHRVSPGCRRIQAGANCRLAYQGCAAPDPRDALRTLAATRPAGPEPLPGRTAGRAPGGVAACAPSRRPVVCPDCDGSKSTRRRRESRGHAAVRPCDGVTINATDKRSDSGACSGMGGPGSVDGQADTPGAAGGKAGVAGPCATSGSCATACPCVGSRSRTGCSCAGTARQCS